MSASVDMTLTRAAVELYDATMPTVRAMMEWHATAELAQMWEAALVENVGRAFFQETNDRNCLENCLLLHPGPAVPAPGEELSFVRRMIAKY